MAINRLALFCGSALGDSPVFKQAAYELGQELAKANVELVFGGGMCGLMGAAARGVIENGGKIIPVSTPVVWDIEIGKTTGAKPEDVFDYRSVVAPIMAENITLRKKMMRDLSDAVCVLPGSLGTFDEFFETLCLLFIKEISHPIVILDIDNYWQGAKLLLDTAIDKGFGKPYINDLVNFVASPKEVLPRIFEISG